MSVPTAFINGRLHQEADVHLNIHAENVFYFPRSGHRRMPEEFHVYTGFPARLFQTHSWRPSPAKINIKMRSCNIHNPVENSYFPTECGKRVIFKRVSVQRVGTNTRWKCLTPVLGLIFWHGYILWLAVNQICGSCFFNRHLRCRSDDVITAMVASSTLLC